MAQQVPIAGTDEAQPAGSVTLMFTDIEGSTKLLERLREGYAVVLDEHRAMLRAAFERHGGREIDTQGNSFFVAFELPGEAIECAVEIERELATHEWPDAAVVRVRIGIHTGSPTLTPTGFVGIDVHRAARVSAAAHGGQVLVTEATTLAAGELPDKVETRSLGIFRFKGLDEPLTVLQLSAPGLAIDFPPIRTSAPEDEPPSAGNSPYKGLLRFEEMDADRFFGREGVVAAIADAVEQQQFVAVVGASGSGKSSIVRAGVVPALRSGGHKLLVITPTADPFAAVAAALSMDDGAKALQRFALVKKAVLVVDQLEELFTLCRSESMRADFVAALMSAVERGVHVLITLRADFYAEVANFPELRAQVTEYQFYVGPMVPADLRRAIEEPARLGGWDLAPGLVDLLLRDVGAEPGALPLLSTLCWKRGCAVAAAA